MHIEFRYKIVFLKKKSQINPEYITKKNACFCNEL